MTMSVTERQIDRFDKLFEFIPDGSAIDTETWMRRHRIMLVILGLHVPALVGLGLLEGPEPISGATLPEIAMGELLLWVGIIAVLTAVAALPMLPRRARTGAVALALTWASTVLVSFSGGFIEAHFHYFVAIVWLAVYEDWVPLAIGVAVVAGTHQLFSLFEMGMMFNHEPAMENHGFWANVHAVFVLAGVVGVLQLWSSLESSRADIEEKLAEIATKSDEIDQLETDRERIKKAQQEIEAQKQEFKSANEELERKATDFSAVMTQAADGDLTVRMDADTDAKAMKKVAESANNMLEDVELVVAEMQGVVTAVSDASAETETGTAELRRASEDVSVSIQEIADGADEQREMLNKTTDDLTDLSATVEEIAASTERVSDVSAETSEVAETSEATAQEAISEVRQAAAVVNESVTQSEKLNMRMTEIAEITDLIAGIADQTNLLALNASIEAARASGTASGETDVGAGFTVVADEVKHLAEETQESVAEIEDLISETQAQTSETVAIADEAQNRMESGVKATEEVLTALDVVKENARQADAGVSEITDATSDQAEATEEVLAALEGVSEISVSSAEEAGTVSAAAEEQASSMTQLEENAGMLESRAEQLDELTEKFTTKAFGSVSAETEATARRVTTPGDD